MPTVSNLWLCCFVGVVVGIICVVFCFCFWLCVFVVFGVFFGRCLMWLFCLCGLVVNIRIVKKGEIILGQDRHQKNGNQIHLRQNRYVRVQKEKICGCQLDCFSQR